MGWSICSAGSARAARRRSSPAVQLPRSAQEIWKFGNSVARDRLRPGDLVFYDTLKRPYSHVGVYLGDNRFIHSPASGGRVSIVEMDQRYWAARWNGAKRVAP